MRRLLPAWWIVLLASAAALFAMLPFGEIVDLKITKSFYDQDTIRSALDIYRDQNQRYPTSTDGLGALVPQIAKRISMDPWGSPYVYRATSEGGFVLYSVGADGLDNNGGGDDVTTRDKTYECSTYGVDCGPDPWAVGMLLALGSFLGSGLVGLVRGARYLAYRLRSKPRVEA